MPNEKAKNIIEEAMASPEKYKEMARRESEVWSRHFTDPAHKEVREREKSAADVLGNTQRQLSLAKVIKEQGLKLKSGLSLGCGSGRAERVFLKQGICESFHGIDIAQDAVEEARNQASGENLNCTYDVQDLNFVTLPANSFDLVVAQTSLHHVLRLEHVFDQIVQALKPGGVFWVHDYVGETQFQFSDERLKIMNDLLGLLPECLRINHFNQRPISSVVRREPGQLVSPFECIRSGEIRELLFERFDVLASHETTTFMDRVAGLGMTQNYVKNEDTVALFRILQYFDQLLASKGWLPAVQGQYLLTAKVKIRASTGQ